MVGASLSLQPFELWTKLALMGANAVAVLGAGALRATYSHNWKALEVRRDVLCSLWFVEDGLCADEPGDTSRHQTLLAPTA